MASRRRRELGLLGHALDSASIKSGDPLLDACRSRIDEPSRPRRDALREHPREGAVVPPRLAAGWAGASRCVLWADLAEGDTDSDYDEGHKDGECYHPEPKSGRPAPALIRRAPCAEAA